MKVVLIILVTLIIGSGAFLVWQFISPNLGSTAPKASPVSGPVNLQFWGVFDDATTFQPFIAAYQQSHPGVSINYTRKELSLYEFVSLNLLASQEGPDVWLIPADWLPKHHDKLSPVPEGLLAKQNSGPVKTGLFQKKPPVQSNVSLFKQLFAPVTADNNLGNNKVTTLPLSVDTLGLFANPVLLDAAGIKNLPATWDEVLVAVKKLAKHGKLNIDQPAIGLGTANNVSRASEILATVMMQNHTPMISSDHREALFNQTVTKATGEPYQPGPAALDFYTSFASPTTPNYSWNASQPNDFAAFVAGKLPLMIDYSYRVADLKQQNPTLTFATGALPQTSQTDAPLTLTSGLVVGVPIVSRHPSQAWDFISFLTNRQNSLAYSHATARPPARLELANDPGTTPLLQPFVSQIGYATSWYRNEINQTDMVFKQAIEAVLAGQPIPDVTNKLTKQTTHILRGEPYE